MGSEPVILARWSAWSPAQAITWRENNRLFARNQATILPGWVVMSVTSAPSLDLAAAALDVVRHRRGDGSVVND